MSTLKRDVRERGLPSLNQAREERRRAFVFGKVKLRAMPPHFWLWTAVVIGGFSVVYFRVAQGKIESRRSQVMAKQRAVARTLGPQIFPFRDQIELWVRELAAAWPGDFVDRSVALEKIQTTPGVYLRLRMQNAQSPKTIRKAAQASLLDGFTSCLFVRNDATDPTKGPACRVAADCASGKLCNEWNVCADPPRPYNMRLAYRALRVLSSEWTDEVYAATSELGLNAYDRDLDSVTKRDVPVAIEVLTRSRYFTLVLDEDPREGLPAEIPDAGESAEERVQRAPHTARVGIWDLKTRNPLLRMRTQAAGEFIPVGARVVRNEATVAAQKRQTNSCALALNVRGGIEKAAGQEAQPAAGGAADAGAPAANAPR